MSRQNRPRRPGIRGPQSALTDFLASHNISANQIRQDAIARRRAAIDDPEQGEADDAEEEQVAESPSAAQNSDSQPPSRSTRRRAGETDTQALKRKKEEQKHIEKIKASKTFKNLASSKRRHQPEDGSDYEEELARALYEQSSAPLPGQMDNCANCGKRFTVTPYSRAAPDGSGLLCSPCGKELEKGADDVPKKKKRATASGGRRKVQSKILDGTYQVGAKSLMALCIETLVKNLDLAESLGDLPPTMVDRIGRMLSKRRLLNPQTLNLFLNPKSDHVFIYDGSKLSSDDMCRILQTVPGLKKLKIRNAIQFKDEVMEYFLSRQTNLESFSLHGSNLLSEELWHEFLAKKGETLTSLKVYYTDRHFGDETLGLLASTCPSLNRLKVKHNQKVSADGVKQLGQVKTLEHISLQLHKPVHSDVYVDLIGKIGHGLQTLSLSVVPDADNTILDALHNKCRSLAKLRITDSEVMTDEGFVRLFSGWLNPPLKFLDLQKCRQIDSAHPRANPDDIGLCSKGFKALMKHSGAQLETLNVHACRHISTSAFEEVFAPGKLYPELVDLEISFCEHVTDFIVGCIFRACPKLRELNVFGCMKVKDVKVPKGKILVGVPNAVGMQIDGNDH